MKLKSLLILIIGVLFVSNLVIWIFIFGSVGDKNLKVSFLDVGQGDAIFIESPSGVQLLVDGGPNLSVLRQLGRQMRFFDRKIDAVLATHPDADHIGGLPEVLDRFQVSNIFLTGVRNITPVFEAYEENISAEGAKNINVLRGGVIDLGGGAFAEILFPDRPLDNETDPNTSSVILRLIYGETSFLLTGDAPKEVENYLALIDGERLRSTVLKVGHHGSRTSTSPVFVSAVFPEYAVISAGCDNRYGHPHAEVLETLERQEVEIFSTCEDGAVVFESDGRQIIVR